MIYIRESLKRKGSYLIILIIFFLSACQLPKSNKSQEKSYSHTLAETLLDKLFYNPDIINNLSFIADGENNFALGYNKDVTFYFQTQFIKDTASYEISNEELYLNEAQTEICLEHEGNRTNRIREFSPYRFDEANFFQPFKSIQSNYILLSENHSMDELVANGIIVSFYKPDKTSNSIYQLIKMTNVNESRYSLMTVSFSRDMIDYRAYSLSSHYLDVHFLN